MKSALVLSGFSRDGAIVPDGVTDVIAGPELVVPEIVGNGAANLLLIDTIPQTVTRFESVILVVTRGGLNQVWVPDYVRHVILLESACGATVVGTDKTDLICLWEETFGTRGNQVGFKSRTLAKYDDLASNWTKCLPESVVALITASEVKRRLAAEVETAVRCRKQAEENRFRFPDDGL